MTRSRSPRLYRVAQTIGTVFKPAPTMPEPSFGHVICWRLYGGEAPGQITEMVITNSRSGGGRELTRQQAEAAVGFAISDLCPDAAPASGR
jgi:Protein of unknown function (DUF732)